MWEQTATCATYSINWLVFITEMKSVYCAVRTRSLNSLPFFFKGLRVTFASRPRNSGPQNGVINLLAPIIRSWLPVFFYLWSTGLMVEILYRDGTFLKLTLCITSKIGPWRSREFHSSFAIHRLAVRFFALATHRHWYTQN
jgi:hypothetical protein